MSEGIAYQNKDILFKILGQTYKEKSFAASSASWASQMTGGPTTWW